MSEPRWIFNCPIHGDEREVFCFRAQDEALRNKWRKVKVMEFPIPHTEEELDKLLAERKW